VIALLSGIVVERGADRVVLETGGIGYLVFVSVQTLAALPTVGGAARLLIHSHQAQDAPLALFGFAEPGERNLFELLLSVHGVGPRLAQSILGGMGASELTSAIAAGNSARLRAVKGVGAKIAERVVLELKDKVQRVAHAEPAAAEARGGANDEVVRTLVGLGYKALEAEKAAAAAAARAPGASADRLLREALRQMQPR
jgi:Holliday junction DNA helicase RuvA